MIKTISATVALAGLAGLAACGSSPDPSTPSVSGTETFSGTVTGSRALAALTSPNPNPPLTFPVFTWTGPVRTSISNYTLPSGNNKEVERTFKTPAGDFTVTRTPNTQRKNTTRATGPVHGICTFRGISSGFYTVVPGESTGKFAGATGHGTFTITLSGSGPISPASAKACTFGSNGPNISKLSSASITFHATGPLTVTG
jgi:hypothetical protein